jgi:glycosyltransferase involved in cell wall biosynthesis
MNEKVSVIIPLLNKAPYISRAIKSVLNQTVQNFEIIVIDGGSEDNGPKIVKNFIDPRIQFFIQSGKGVSNARNEAVHFSKNEYIAFLDADDEWMPNHLETILKLIEKYPEAGMFTTAFKIQTAEGKTHWAHYESIPNHPWEGLLPNYFKSAALGDTPVWTSVVVIPRKIFDEAGGFPEGYWWGEDVDLFGKIALKYPVAFSWEFGAIYHHDALNRACNKITTVNFEEEPFFYTAQAALKRQEISPEFIESINEYLANRKIFRAIHYVRAGSPDIAQHILKSCSTRWFYHKKMKWLLLSKLPYPLFLFIRDIKRTSIKTIRKGEN